MFHHIILLMLQLVLFTSDEFNAFCELIGQIFIMPVQIAIPVSIVLVPWFALPAEMEYCSISDHPPVIHDASALQHILCIFSSIIIPYFIRYLSDLITVKSIEYILVRQEQLVVIILDITEDVFVFYTFPALLKIYKKDARVIVCS